ncbi:MAG: hypothetical protein JWM47_1716 [Acidimicrobiales bacterium]|nr:hypothetical protein [Acidimicrobiales bacterium]
MAIALVTVAVLVGCRADRASERGQATTTEPPIDPSVAVCKVIAAPWDRYNPVRLLYARGLTFSELVAQNQRNDTNDEASGTIGFARSPIFDGDEGYVGQLGPYEPALAYLETRGVAWDPKFKGEVKVPRRTRAVVESAQRLDRDLTHGLCAEGRARRRVGG